MLALRKSLLGQLAFDFLDVAVQHSLSFAPARIYEQFQETAFYDVFSIAGKRKFGLAHGLFTVHGYRYLLWGSG